MIDLTIWVGGWDKRLTTTELRDRVIWYIWCNIGWKQHSPLNGIAFTILPIKTSYILSMIVI